MNNFKKFRKETGMTQKQFAEYFGLPLRTMQGWESGRYDPPTYLLRMLTWIWKLEHKEEKHE